MSTYYDSNAGDKDARDLIQMRKEEMLREGADGKLLDEEKFGRAKLRNPFKKERVDLSKQSKGIGRLMLEKQGWKEGESIGLPQRAGLIKPLDGSDGKLPKDKTGIGYYGEKVDKEKVIEEQKRRRNKEHLNSEFYIGSKYTEQSEPDSLMRRFPQSMKYRNSK